MPALVQVSSALEVPAAGAFSGRIVGWDCSTVATGYGVIHIERGLVSYVECGVLTAPKHWPKARRLASIARDIEGVLADERLFPRELQWCAAAEDGVFRFASAALAGGESRGLVIALVGCTGRDVALYPPMSAKKLTTGQGRAEKAQVAACVARLLGMRNEPEHDAADALAVALCHAHDIAIGRQTA